MRFRRDVLASGSSRIAPGGLALVVVGPSPFVVVSCTAPNARHPLRDLLGIHPLCELARPLQPGSTASGEGHRCVLAMGGDMSCADQRMNVVQMGCNQGRLAMPADASVGKHRARSPDRRNRRTLMGMRRSPMVNPCSTRCRPHVAMT